ncbi:hypothetical protein OJ998_04780 [Solirubrobacter taibaiensis]|nr:hypothetical protein [Solirubrobacter taibaiensis]
MGPIATTVIECRNCAPGVGPAFYASTAAVVVAAVALIINAREHREFMRTTRARARLAFELTLANYETDADGVLVHEAGSIRPVMRLRIRNDGDRAALETLVNVTLASEGVTLLRWCGPTGQEIESPRAHPSSEPVQINGEAVPSSFLPGTVPRITRKGGNIVNFCFTLALPDDGSEICIPIRITAQADEIPDDVDEYVHDTVVRARRDVRRP